VKGGGAFVLPGSPLRDPPAVRLLPSICLLISVYVRLLYSDERNRKGLPRIVCPFFRNHFGVLWWTLSVGGINSQVRSSAVNMMPAESPRSMWIGRSICRADLVAGLE
jgi:hypothetical protein